ncbi:MAG TPA: PIG-L family deacetylase [Acidobacteriaceae bacterium]|jgi:LmbE family N-acetylglucosaminyl deacetylase|nr:PIG-L family deacetylase [Acidobacteriaceae bacterium]
MSGSTRRSFLKDVSASVAALSIGSEPLQASAMPGRPSSEAGSSGEHKASNTMAIAAHPGDAFFAMGTPVALATGQGAEGLLLSLTLGEKGSATIPPSQYGAMQRSASQKAAAMLGATAEFLHYPDGEVPINDEAKFAVCDMIRQFKPDIVVTHWKGSWHKDHRACYEIVADAIFYAALPTIVRKLPAHSVRELFFNDNWEDAAGFVPDTYLDITPVFARWMDACAIFPMWRGENGFRYNDYYASLAVARGCVANFKKAVALMSPAEQRVRHIRAL